VPVEPPEGVEQERELPGPPVRADQHGHGRPGGVLRRRAGEPFPQLGREPAAPDHRVGPSRQQQLDEAAIVGVAWALGLDHDDGLPGGRQDDVPTVGRT
jgi:hypothetical protein